MQVAKGVDLNYGQGKIVLSAEVAQFAVPVLDDLAAKVESGEIDPVKGTDLDKAAMLSAIAFLKKEVTK